MKKIAVIDIGSNTIKLLVASGLTSIVSHYEAIEECRISKGISSQNPVLTDASIQQGLSAVHRLVNQALEQSVSTIQIVATSAVRDAANGKDFAKQIESTTGYPVCILSGQQEAHSIAGGLRFDPELKSLHNYVHFDLGGGSLECNLIQDGELAFATSMPLGAVRVTEQLVRDPESPFTAADAASIDQLVKATFKTYKIPATNDCGPMIFTGGSATISRALLHHRPIQGKDLGGNMIRRSELEHLLSQLAPLDFEQRLSFEFLPRNRADVVCAAIQLLISTMNFQNKVFFQHSLFALRHGIAANMLDLA